MLSSNRLEFVDFEKSRGFTIIEILIAIFILAIGLLGFAALQLTALSNSQEGFMRSQATLIAENLATRMRSNHDFINSLDVGNNAYTLTNVGPVVAGGYVRYCKSGSPAFTEAAPTDCNTNLCTNAQFAVFDRRAVCDELRATQLPEGEIGVRCFDRDATDPSPDTDVCSSDSLITIYVGWQPNIRTEKGEQTQTVSGQCATEMGLTGTKSCVALEIYP